MRDVDELDSSRLFACPWGHVLRCAGRSAGARLWPFALLRAPGGADGHPDRPRV